MIASFVEGKVEPEQFDVLVQGYRALLAAGLPDAIRATYLMQAADGSAVWRIVTIWRSCEDLQTMRASNPVPPAVQVFRSAKVEPAVRFFDVIVSS